MEENSSIVDDAEFNESQVSKTFLHLSDMEKAKLKSQMAFDPGIINMW